jgi:chromosome segregation protein
MRLKQVRLSGFKSFCDNSEFSFLENGITMVVGPNGCGKSNVVDAVRWALGEQSPRLMRSSAMGDVIFAGSTTRRPIGRAEVTLLFDNSDHSALDKYNEYGEIAVTRRLYRSGESEYLINKLPSRLLDIRELVMDTGAAGRSYSIVEQGRVEEFVTASPQERRAFMEEAAGIMRYKTKRIAAEKKLEQTRQNLLRVEDVLGELNRQEGALREQMEAARAFRALQAETARLQGDLARLRHARSAQSCAELEAHLARLGEEGAGVEQTLALLTTRMEALTLERTRQETRLRESRGALYGKERELQHNETRLALERQNLENTRAWTARQEQALEELHVQKRTLAEGQHQTREEALKQERQAESLRLELERLAGRHDACQAAAQAATGRASTLQERLLESHTQLQGLEQQQQFLAERLLDDERRHASQAERIAAVRAELEQVQAGVATGVRRHGETASGLAAVRAEGETLAGEIAAQQARLEAQREREGTTDLEVLEARSRLETLSEIEAGYQGFGESVRAFLAWAEANPEAREALGMLGPLADQLSVPEALLDGMGDFLAPQLEVIVVRSAGALPRLAEQLDALELGGVRFLALDALPGNGKGNGHGHLSADEDRDATLAHLLTFAPPSEALGEALFGSTRLLPAGTPPHPLPQPWGQGEEWVTRDGQLQIDGKARFTLGRSAEPGAGVLRRRAEIAALTVRLAEREGEQRRVKEEGSALLDGLEGLQARFRAGEERRAALELALRETAQEIVQGERETRRLEQVLGTVQREAAQFQEALTRARAQQEELAAQALRWREARERLQGELNEARVAEETARAALEEAGEHLTERKVEHGRTLSRLESLTQRVGDQEREREVVEGRLAEAHTALADQQGRQEAAARAIETVTAALAALQQSLDGLRQAERQERDAFDTLSAEHGRLEEQSKARRRQQAENQGRLHQVELALTAERMRLEQFAAQLAGLPQGDGPPEAQDERALENKLAAARARLQRMEGINLGAPEEYEALDMRLTFLRTQQEDLTTASEDLEASIRRMNQESRRRFRETFEQVNEKFQLLFPQVFGGGEARLVLTDSEDPLQAGVDIIAQPPGKKLQGLNLLSGGEKALTAISLIFSFFLHKPSPFCLLDEVDAPLDDVNVTRFNRLIQNMTEHSQFIIITHNKRTMEVADRLYGVTMEEAGVSKIVSVNLSGQA